MSHSRWTIPSTGFTALDVSLYNLGDLEYHLAFTADNFDELHEKHQKMGVICFENPGMGIYFISDPDGYWIEIVGGPEEIYNRAGSHHPAIVFNEEVLPLGAAVLAGCAGKWLEKHSV